MSGTTDALGMIECRGFAAMVEASDAMVKAAKVDLVYSVIAQVPRSIIPQPMPA